ncbi:MAG: hypothetical protein AB7I40_04685 [Nocardioides sp.]
MSTEESPAPDTEEPDGPAPATQSDERAPQGDSQRADAVKELTDDQEPDKWDAWVGEGQ